MRNLGETKNPALSFHSPHTVFPLGPTFTVFSLFSFPSPLLCTLLLLFSHWAAQLVVTDSRNELTAQMLREKLCKRVTECTRMRVLVTLTLQLLRASL